MDIQTNRTKRVMATGKPYRGVMIYQTADGYTVMDEWGKGFFFSERQAALDFIDRLFGKTTISQVGA